MLNLWKDVEETELEALNEALSVFSTVVAKLESLQTKVKNKYAGHCNSIEMLEHEKETLNGLDSKIHNTLLKLKELVA